MFIINYKILNKKLLGCLLIIIATCFFIPTILAQGGDSQPPVIDFDSIIVRPKTVNVGDSITISATVTDNLSGVYNIQIVYRSASGVNWNFKDSYYEEELLSVDFEVSREITQYDEDGVWQLSSIFLVDHAGNIKNYGREEIANPSQYDFMINNPGDPVVEIPDLEILIGDINGDGNIDVLDVTLIMQYCLDLREFNESQKISADVNGDGVINILDVVLIMQYSLDIIESFDKLEY